MTDDPADRNSKDLQSAFDEQADRLGLDPEPEPTASPGRLMGIAYAARSILDYGDDREPAPLAIASEHDAIEAVIRGFESLHPDELAERWKEFATDPCVTFSDHGIGLIEDDGLETVHASAEFKRTCELFPPQTPRALTVSGLVVVHVEKRRAAATYRVDETFANGKRSAQNCAAVLIATSDGWKITGITFKNHEA